MVLNKLAGHPDSYRRRKEYKMGETIGEGTFGIVRQAEWTTHNPPKRVAIKVIAKRLLKDNVDVVEQELQVLKQCDHPNIIKLFDDFESKDKVRISRSGTFMPSCAHASSICVMPCIQRLHGAA